MKAKLGEAEFIPHVVWGDAEARLGLMEEQTRRALANRWRLTAINVVTPVEWESPLVLPDHAAIIKPEEATGLVLGPDGKPL